MSCRLRNQFNILLLKSIGAGGRRPELSRGGDCVATSNEYRRHAWECLQIARTALSLDERALLIEMAKTWHRLAQEKERSEQGQEAAE